MMNREVPTPSPWRSLQNSRATYILLGVLVTCAALLAAALPLALATTGTFRTTNLIVDQDSKTATLHIDSSGQSELFSTFYDVGGGADGGNIWIGGGGQSSTTGGGSHTLGSSNTSLGQFALNPLTTGSYNTAVGQDAADSCTTCIDTTAIGQASLLSLVSGIENTAVGVQALELVTTGSFNTAVGLNALQFTNGQNNTAIGLQAGESSNTGSSNIFVGEDAGQFATTGSNNTIVGTQSALALTTGDAMTTLGFATGAGITTGRADTIIGANVSGLTAALSNNIILADGDGNIRAQCDNTGAWDVHTALIHNVVDPAAAQDAATKNYVDTHGGTGTVTSITCGTGLTCSTNPITTTGTISLSGAATGSLAVTVNADPGGTVNLSTGTIAWFYNADGGTGGCRKPSATTPVAGFRWKQLDNGLAAGEQCVAIGNTTSYGTYTQGTSFTTTNTDDIFGTSMASTNVGTLGANSGAGTNYGFAFHVPLNTSAHTFKIWTMVHGATGTLTAHLEDGSAVDATGSYSATSGTDQFREIDITVTAGSSTFIDFKWVVTAGTSGFSEIGLSAVTET